MYYFIIQLLKEGGVNLTTSAEAEIARDIKEQHCYVAENFYEESVKATMGSNLEQLYYMPDGNPVALNSERFRLVYGFNAVHYTFYFLCFHTSCATVVQ